MDDPHTQWYSRLAKCPIACAALITDERDRVLLVEPTYKDGWLFPGGVGEAGEAPHTAAEREVAEELGLSLAAGDLLVVEHVLAFGRSELPLTVFVFDFGTVPAGTPRQLSSDELADSQFLHIEEAERLLHPHERHRLRPALQARSSGRVAYLR